MGTFFIKVNETDRAADEVTGGYFGNFSAVVSRYLELYKTPSIQNTVVCCLLFHGLIMSLANGEIGHIFMILKNGYVTFQQ